MAISQRQQRYLLDRLQEARCSKPVEYSESEDYRPPAKVVLANRQIEKLKKIVSEHEQSRRKVRKARNEKIVDAYTVVKETILFGDEKKALAALKAFENRKF